MSLHWLHWVLELRRSVITEKVPTRAFSYLKAPSFSLRLKLYWALHLVVGVAHGGLARVLPRLPRYPRHALLPPVGGGQRPRVVPGPRLPAAAGIVTSSLLYHHSLSSVRSPTWRVAAAGCRTSSSCWAESLQGTRTPALRLTPSWRGGCPRCVEI